MFTSKTKNSFSLSSLLVISLTLSACFDDKTKGDTSSTQTPQSINSSADCLRFGDVVQLEFISALGETAGIIAHGNTVVTNATHLPLADKFIIGFHNMAAEPSDILVYPLNRSVNDGCIPQNGLVTLRNSWASHLAHTATGRVVGDQPHTGAIAGDRVFRLGAVTTAPSGNVMLDTNETVRIYLNANGTVHQSGRISRASNGDLVTTPGSPSLSEIRLTRLDPKKFVYTKAAVFSYNTTSEPCTHGGRVEGVNCFIAHKNAINPTTKVALIPPTDSRLRYATVTQPGQNSSCSIGLNDSTTHCRLPDFGQDRNYFIANDSFYVTAQAEKCDYAPWESQPQPTQAAARADWENTGSAFPQFATFGFSGQFDDAAARAVYLRQGYVASARPCTP